MNYKANAKERILKAAVKVFAEKSYEGSRIEEIAKEAEVPKSLIYYHFKSKEEIFQCLIDSFVEEYLALIAASVKEDHGYEEGALKQRMQTRYSDFGQKNADLVRVILIDSLKKSKDNPVLFRIVDAMITKEKELKGLQGELQERRIAEFFTSFMPNYAYLCFGDAWVNYFLMDRKEFDTLYLKVYEETHGAYHRNLEQKNKEEES